MNNKNKTDKKWIFRLLPALAFVMICLVACHFKFKDDDEALAILNQTLVVNAGDEITFDLTVLTDCQNNYDNENMIIAVYAPKAWKPAENTTITFVCDKIWGSEVKTMSLVPEGTSPKNQPGLSWEQALKNRTKDDPNIDGADMQWVTFVSDDSAPVSAGLNPEIKVTVTMKTGPDNMRCRLGFFVNNTDDGLGGDDQYYGWIFTQCFETINGEGDVIDFCELHYNTAMPGSSTQNDILTFKFNGGIDLDPAMANDLAYEDNIYYCATAHTAAGATYTKKVKMTKENEFGRTFAITYWPEGFFGIDRTETITEIKYYFSNENGSKFVDLYDDRTKDSDDGGAPSGKTKGLEGEREIQPFVYGFTCR